MRVLGISVWIYFIWTFIVGVLLFFYTVHGTLFEGFVVGDTPTPVGASSLDLGSFTPSHFVQYYDINSQSWTPLNRITDRLLYLQKLPLGSELVSLSGSYALLFKTDGTLVLYNKESLNILWSYATGNKSQYLYHNGNIFVINTDNSYGNSPFIPPTNSAALASIGSLIGIWSGSSTGLTAGSLTTSYLQVLDNADLVLYSGNGTVLFRTKTDNEIQTPCTPAPTITYPLERSDCPMIMTQRTTLMSDIVTYTQSNNIIQLTPAQNSWCLINEYYKNLSCSTYSGDMTLPTLSVNPINTATAIPTTNIKGTLVQGSNEITVTGDLTASIKPGDMVYLGYGTDINGPFIVSSRTSSKITITKYYVGVNITNAIISIKSLFIPTTIGNSMPVINTPPITFQSRAVIDAAVYPGDSFINISSASSDSLPDRLDLGDIIYIKQDLCNVYDIDNNDGTCTAYLCNPGEHDLMNGKCQPYSCHPNDIDKNNGLCDSSGTILCQTYTFKASELCLANPTSENCVSSTVTSSDGKICTTTFRDKSKKNNGGNLVDDTTSITFPYVAPLTTPSRTYDKILNGVAGTVYTKNSTNPSYIYSKTLGPYIIAMKPTTNKIMVKTFQTGDLDSNGAFILNPTAQWRKDIAIWVKLHVRTFPPLSQYTIPGLTELLSGAFRNFYKAMLTLNPQTNSSPHPAQPTTVNLKALADAGLPNAKLYRASYNDGVNSMSYTAISPGDTNTAVQSSWNSIVLTMNSSSNGMININGLNLIIGQKYFLTVSVKVTSTASCILYVMSSSSRAYKPDGTNIDIDVAASVTLLSSFKVFTWNFVAVSSNLRFKVVATPSAEVTLEFNTFTIQGGISGPTTYLGCANGSTTTAGVTTCN
jgi:hypothetical protein